MKNHRIPTRTTKLLACAVMTAVSWLSPSARADKITADNQMGSIDYEAPRPQRDIAESREVLIDPTRANDLPGSRFSQAQAFQFHNEEDEKTRLREEAMTRRLDRIGRYRDW